ncbi:hypothetical protein AB0O91_21480 [Kitasatospora sp. NPDC089797]|uniref:hypothetical protein n=1 Tax=Kitasatospora sp. NPDC089797 TaxID=3155298 RepID=UPI00342FA672
MYGQGQQYPQGQPPYGGQPYGGPPPQQPPHGAPQQPYGYPPQQPYGAPQPPYGPPGYPPQAPYGQPGYPPQAPYGQPGYPPPPRKGRGGLVAGLVIGALVLGGGGFAAWKFLGSDGDPGGTYKISTPQTLPDGYVQKTAKEEAVDPAKADAKEAVKYGSDLTVVVANYTKGGDPLDAVTVAGLYGTLNSPDRIIEDSRTGGSSLTWTTPLTDFPAQDGHSSSARLACGVYSLLGGKSQSTVCIWADRSTYARVTFLKGGLTGTGGSALTPAQAAERTRAVRDAMKVAK